KVNTDDFTQFQNGYNGGDYLNSPYAIDWHNGDFTYDGKVNSDDFNAFLAGYGAFNTTLVNYSPDPALRAELLAFAEANGIPLTLDPGPVPEPASLGVIAMAGVGLLARRRRSRN